MKLITLFILIALSTTQILASDVFTPADPMDAPAGMEYDIEQPEVLNPFAFDGKTVAIFVSHGVQESEITYPYEYLTKRGAKVSIISPWWTDGRVMAVKYLKPTLWINTDYNFQEALGIHFDMIILTGGAWNSAVIRTDENAIRMLKHHHNKWKIPVAAICAAPQILISADLVKNKQIIGSPTIRTDLINAGATYLDNYKAHTDGNIITAKGPEEVLEFMKEIHKKLRK